MSNLPDVSGDECIEALERLGYRVMRVKGSHARLICPGHTPITVPKHHELGRGILRKIIHNADISVEEFIELLK